MFGERAIFGVGEGFKNCFGVNSCSWTTFIFYVTLISDIWFWLIFGVIFYFFGSWWAIFGVWVGFKNFFGVSACRLITFVVRVVVVVGLWQKTPTHFGPFIWLLIARISLIPFSLSRAFQDRSLEYPLACIWWKYFFSLRRGDLISRSCWSVLDFLIFQKKRFRE